MVESSGSSRSSGVLSEHGYPITTYYAAKTRRVCDLVIRDAEPLAHARCGVSCTGGVVAARCTRTADARDGWVCPSLQIVTSNERLRSIGNSAPKYRDEAWNGVESSRPSAEVGPDLASTKAPSGIEVTRSRDKPP
jgi:hypothetical protein